MTTLDLAAASLATMQIVETWRHGSIFAGARAEVEARTGFFAELLTCPFCLSHWVAGGAVVVCLLAQSVHPWLMFPVWAFAVTRAAQLLHDATHSISRSPGAGDNLPGE